MKKTIIAASLFLSAWSGASAYASNESWACKQGDLTREVLVIYPEAPALLPCRVFYSKPDENVVPRVIWEARNTEGYCKEKATDFVGTLESMGWQCGRSESD